MMTPADFLFMQQELWKVYGPIMPWLAMAYFIVGLFFMFLILVCMIVVELRGGDTRS